jgi:hypothetical protein
MSSAEILGARLVTLDVTDNLQKLLENARSQIREHVKATPSAPTTTIPTPDVGAKIKSEIWESYCAKVIGAGTSFDTLKLIEGR